jgi:hypothetical protein
MSSNMYGFECWIEWNGRNYGVQITYDGTDEDDPYSLERVTASWESDRPQDVARYELTHRTWPDGDPVRASVWYTWGGSRDPDDDYPPPQPPEREVFRLIAEGHATDMLEGWDT